MSSSDHALLCYLMAKPATTWILVSQCLFSRVVLVIVYYRCQGGQCYIDWGGRRTCCNIRLVSKDISYKLVFHHANMLNSRVVYRFTQKQIRELENLPEGTDRLAANGLEDVEEGAPLLQSLSPNITNREGYTLSP